MVPALGPPMFAISAKLLLSRLWYSSQRGSCQADQGLFAALKKRLRQLVIVAEHDIGL